MKNLMTDWQTVIFRNYGMVPDEALAKVLGTDVQTVRRNAEKLGLKHRNCNADWVKKGFVTIFRNNWDLLPEEEIRTLLGVNGREYASLLEEYDFLSVKLGKKPETAKPVYKPLTAEEEARKGDRRKIPRAGSQAVRFLCGQPVRLVRAARRKRHRRPVCFLVQCPLQRRAARR